MTFACSRISDEEEPRSGVRDRYREPHPRYGPLTWMGV
jgi:hypothetical protein